VAERSTASIPCDVIIQSKEADALLMVLCYRDEDYSKPIFTYDTRSVGFVLTERPCDF